MISQIFHYFRIEKLKLQEKTRYIICKELDSLGCSTDDIDTFGGCEESIEYLTEETVEYMTEETEYSTEDGGDNTPPAQSLLITR